MKLATVKSKNDRNGELIVVSRDHLRGARFTPAMSLKNALENWERIVPTLEKIFDELNSGKGKSFPLDVYDCIAPLPDAPGFYDGSAFLSHVYRARKARGDVMPESAKVTPLMYQGVSDHALSHQAPIELIDPKFGGDFEGEFAVVTTDVPRGTKAADMEKYIALILLFNDITYREILKVEIETKFGFLQSKPNSSFAPFAVTPKFLGDYWKSGRIHLDLNVKLNGVTMGNPNGREMHFSFYELVEHAAKTRPLSAGSIIGSGTVSNEDKSRGFTCLTEKRFQEILDSGKAIQPWLKVGDEVWMDVTMNEGSVFGSIQQKVIL